jgi:Amt family ammonium transporter
VIATVTTLVYCFVVAFILLKVVDALVGLRVNEDEEFAGLDLSQHGENAYTL